jgi:hypothetical protein
VFFIVISPAGCETKLPSNVISYSILELKKKKKKKGRSTVFDCVSVANIRLRSSFQLYNIIHVSLESFNQYDCSSVDRCDVTKGALIVSALLRTCLCSRRTYCMRVVMNYAVETLLFISSKLRVSCKRNIMYTMKPKLGSELCTLCC